MAFGGSLILGGIGSVAGAVGSIFSGPAISCATGALSGAIGGLCTALNLNCFSDPKNTIDTVYHIAALFFANAAATMYMTGATFYAVVPFALLSTTLTLATMISVLACSLSKTRYI